jgi:hypothetical protein
LISPSIRSRSWSESAVRFLRAVAIIPPFFDALAE